MLNLKESRSHPPNLIASLSRPQLLSLQVVKVGTRHERLGTRLSTLYCQFVYMYHTYILRTNFVYGLNCPIIFRPRYIREQRLAIPKKPWQLHLKNSTKNSKSISCCGMPNSIVKKISSNCKKSNWLGFAFMDLIYTKYIHSKECQVK